MKEIDSEIVVLVGLKVRLASLSFRNLLRCLRPRRELAVEDGSVSP